MVFGWLFGKKKPEEKKPEEKKEKTPADKKKKESENQWLYEFLIQYLTSPVWKIPIYDFIDMKCIVFDEEEENKFEYTTIHKEFKDLIEAMVVQLMEDIGIDEDQFFQMCSIGLKNKNHRKIFEQILIVDNFLVFKKLMVKRNKELELEALKEMDKQESGKTGGSAVVAGEPIKKKELQQEKSEIEYAIAASLAADEESKKLADVEDKELQEALMQSQLAFENEQKLEKQISDSKIAEQKAKQTDLSNLPPVEAKKPVVEAKQPEVETKKPEVIPVPVKKEEPKKEEPKEEEKKQDSPQKKQQESLPPIGGLPPIKAPKSLPPLMAKQQHDKPVDDLMKQKENLEEQLKVYKESEDKIKNATVAEPEKKEEESLDERKKRLLAQRELLRKKKQKQREEELKRFQELGTTDDVQGQEKDKAIAKQQSIALDLEQKMPASSNLTAEERKKRLALFSKIKSDMDE